MNAGMNEVGGEWRLSSRCGVWLSSDVSLEEKTFCGI